MRIRIHSKGSQSALGDLLFAIISSERMNRWRWRRGVWVQVECDLDDGFKYGACRRVGRHWLQTCVGDCQTDSGDVARWQQRYGHFGPKFRGVPLGADPSCWGCKERTSQAN